MQKSVVRIALLVGSLLLMQGADRGVPANAAEPSDPSRAEVTAAMKKAATFFEDQVAVKGGYVYFYSPDLRQRFGEGVATESQVWVQPPGTPTVGMAYLRAFEASKDPAYLSAATKAGQALVYGQLKSGGWANCIDFDPQGSRVSLYRNGKGKGRNYSSLDDDQTQSAIRFLMRLDQALKFRNPQIHEATETALRALLAAQFANGAFPQGWDKPVSQDHPRIAASFPDYDWRTEGRIKNYWDMYTLNDDLAGSVSQTLREAHEIYGDDRFRSALLKFGEFLLLAQLPAPQQGWAQQYNYQMQPIWARVFEPAAVAGRETQDVLETLLDLYQLTRDARYLKAYQEGYAYLERSLLPDGRLARYYELKSNHPLYMQRSGKQYELTYDDADLPDHYGWKADSQLRELRRRYEALVRGEEPSSEEPPTGAEVRRILDSLDDEGRWIDTFNGQRLVGDQKFRPGDRYISSETFSRNMETLAAYLR